MAVTRSAVKCLACGAVSTDWREHNEHLADIDHPDKGETWVKV